MVGCHQHVTMSRLICLERPRSRVDERFVCKEHKDECIKFYCKDCKKTLCQSCCIVYHRQCKSVHTLESMIPEMKVTLEARKETLKNKLRNEEYSLDSRKSECSDLQQEKSSIQSKVRSAVQQAIDTLKKKEKRLMDELDEVRDKQMGQLKADIKTGDMAIQIYRQQLEFIDQALSSDSEMDMYDLYQSAAAESEVDVDNLSRRHKYRIKFSQDVEKMNKALEELTVGEIQVIRQGVLDSKCKPSLSKTMDCSTTGDKEIPILCDIICMDVNGINTIIVTDLENACIKAFFTTNNESQHSRLELQGRPLRISKFCDDNKLAITLQSSNQIITVTVSPDLSLLSSIKTRKQYNSLTVLTPTTLAAGSRSSPCVDILDWSGNVLQSISPIYNGKNIIKDPHFLFTTKKGNILVSDCGTKSVVCLTTKGDVVFTYSSTRDRQLRYLGGITSTDTGDILVVDRRGNKVIQLSESGQFVRDLLTSQDGLSYPWCLHYDERETTIYVRHDVEKIQVFTFK